MAATKSYTVTATAGRYLLGRRVTVGDILLLTEKQAEYELARGLVQETKAAVQEKPVEKAAEKPEEQPVAADEPSAQPPASQTPAAAVPPALAKTA